MTTKTLERTHRLTAVGDDVDIEWETADEMSVARVKEVFDSMIQRAFVPFAIDEATGYGPKMKEFDPEAEHVLMVGPLLGG